MSTADQVEESQKTRFEFLRVLYELTEETKSTEIRIWWIPLFLYTRESLRLEDPSVQKTAEYLSQKGLVEVSPAEAWAGFQSSYISITPKGIDAVEEALLHPDKPTKHFPAANIIIVGRMADSHIQQASPAATQVAYSENTHEQLKQLVEWLKHSIAELDLEDQDKSDLQAELLTIEAQTTKSKPSQAIITESLRSIRSILEKVSAILLAQALLERIAEFLARG